jgi:hypothetical protein
MDKTATLLVKLMAVANNRQFMTEKGRASAVKALEDFALTHADTEHEAPARYAAKNLREHDLSKGTSSITERWSTKRFVTGAGDVWSRATTVDSSRLITGVFGKTVPASTMAAMAKAQKQRLVVKKTAGAGGVKKKKKKGAAADGDDDDDDDPIDEEKAADAFEEKREDVVQTPFRQMQAAQMYVSLGGP